MEGSVLYEPSYGDFIVTGFYEYRLGRSLLFSQKRIAVGVEKLKFGIIEVIIQTLLAFFAILIYARILGKQQIGQLTF